jgi:transposase
MASHAKKTAHALEQNRPDVLKQREDWRAAQPTLDPDKLVFLDETWASTAMARRHGRAPRGERLKVGVPHGHWKTTTLVGAIRSTGFTAPRVIDGTVNGERFRTDIAEVLVPALQKGDTVIMDNLPAHKSSKIREMIEAAGAKLLYLPPPDQVRGRLYSPDLNPIEMAFSKLKAMLRKAAERNIEELWAKITELVATFTKQECQNYIAAAGYVPI